MLVAVSVVSAHIAETHKRWRLEAHLRDGQTELDVVDPRFPMKRVVEAPPPSWRKEGYRMLGDDQHVLGPVFDDVSRFGGLIW